MILTKDLLDDLLSLENSIHSLTLAQNPNNLQIESFLRNLEKRRYSILNQIKLYNKNIENEYEKISFKFSPFRNRFSFTPDWTCYIWCKTWYDFNNVVYSYDIK